MAQITVGKLKIGQREEDALLEVIKSGQLSEGRKTFEFEKAWAAYIGTGFAIAFNSGTSGLIAGLTALKIKYNIKDGSKVVTSPLTFIATANAIMHCGLQPVFVDVDRQKLVITPENIEAAVKKDKGIALILPVHLMGYAVDMLAISKIAKKYGLRVMEDASQAHGTLYNNKKLGSFSDLAIFSFYIAHNIQAGEMGAANTDNIELFKLLKKIKTHGRMCDCNVCSRHLGKCHLLKKYTNKEIDLDPRFYHDIIGFNFKTMEFQSALGLLQLSKAQEIFEKRNFNVCYLNRGMKDLEGVLQLPEYSEQVSYLAYPLVIKDSRIISRFRLRRELEHRGIETRPLFGCIPTQQPAYRFLEKKYKNKLPVAEYLGLNGFYIGCHQYLEKADLDKIISVFHEVLK
ncbi:MAG: DegT/DnrJ/EryC1/StrS family aminotransferase [Candidatus Omnitrophica bacterium]|nr:DegT/DnrJ/EryC1/StrS family aminotransferase [Candidatus Omnitrophota bacterium]MDD5653712.1 DegT/DnrJ/EryC1/StrS family aminotransferase [Candidatus Omnitrophota bacterium]